MYIKKTGQAIIIPGGSDKAKKAHKAWRNAVKEAAERYMVAHELETLDEPVEPPPLLPLTRCLRPVAASTCNNT